MAKNNIPDETLGQFGAEMESQFREGNGQQNVEFRGSSAIGAPENIDELRAKASEAIGAMGLQTRRAQEHEERVQELKDLASSGKAGYLPISVTDLPSKGMFYPVGTRIYIKAATMEQIKHWSAMDETNAYMVDEAMNNIIEDCVKMTFGDGDPRFANWRDLVDIDRLYLLIAIHDFTFPAGQNDLQLHVKENEDITITKDQIEFIKFNEKLLKFYDPKERCFIFPTKAAALKGKPLRITFPRLGVTSWIKDYGRKCQEMQENYDQDMFTFALLTFEDWRGLNEDTYYQFIQTTTDWSAYEWTIMAKVKQIMVSAAQPKVSYESEGGLKKEIPLSFRGGYKSLLQQRLDIDL